ncbi:ferredoxin [Kitasatospora sp. NPDC006697]|uniref:ferredoxin n=1 Tax=Kitasatospora sp. NPDC006697 TaxID=3364020 RepID=UPI0036C2454C
MAHLSIDADRCVGSGQCVVLAPEVFGEDEDGFGTVLPRQAAGALEDPMTREAVRSCPNQAILLSE